HGERHVEYLRQRLSEIRLAGSGRANQQDVRLLQLDVVGGAAGVDALVVVVHGDGERLLRALLTDHVLIEDVIDLFGFRNIPKPQILVDVLIELFLDDLVAELDTLVANVDTGTGDQLAHLLLRFSAEAALELTLLVSKAEHRGTRSSSLGLSRQRQALAIFDDGIDYPVVLRLLGSHIIIPIDVPENLVDRLFGRFFVDSRDRLAGRDQIAGRNFYVGCLSADLRDPGLLNEDLGV